MSLLRGNQRKRPKVGVAVIMEKDERVILGNRRAGFGEEKSDPIGGRLKMWNRNGECGERGEGEHHISLFF